MFNPLAKLIQHMCFDTNTNSMYSRGNDERSRSQRMHIYTTLLKQMAPEHLLATFAKVCAEILAAASDGMLSLEDSTGQSVLQVIAPSRFFIFRSPLLYGFLNSKLQIVLIMLIYKIMSFSKQI